MNTTGDRGKVVGESQLEEIKDARMEGLEEGGIEGERMGGKGAYEPRRNVYTQITENTNVVFEVVLYGNKYSKERMMEVHWLEWRVNVGREG